MDEEQKMIHMYESMNGSLSSNCYWEYDDEDHILTCMKDNNVCWSVTREDLIFDWLTKDF